jgi:hypothetical protein
MWMDRVHPFCTLENRCLVERFLVTELSEFKLGEIVCKYVDIHSRNIREFLPELRVTSKKLIEPLPCAVDSSDRLTLAVANILPCYQTSMGYEKLPLRPTTFRSDVTVHELDTSPYMASVDIPLNASTEYEMKETCVVVNPDKIKAMFNRPYSFPVGFGFISRIIEREGKIMWVEITKVDVDRDGVMYYKLQECFTCEHRDRRAVIWYAHDPDIDFYIPSTRSSSDEDDDDDDDD